MESFILHSGLPHLSCSKAWAEIDSAALVSNYRLLCEKTPETRHICVVKADAYGHTAEICVAALISAGCDFFAVSCIEEAIEVRQICNRSGSPADVLILGYTPPEQVSLLIQNDIIQTIVDAEHGIALQKSAKEINKSLRAHIALDTGMNRIGLCARNDTEGNSAAEQIEALYGSESLRVEGLFTHFSMADDTEATVLSDNSYTRRQFERFCAVKNALAERGIKLFSHVCNSAAAIRFPEFALDGVRLGILLYGAPPSQHFGPITTPVMSFKTIVSHIHTLPMGEPVGYGGKFSAETERVIATLPIGYADGFIRAYAGFCVTVHTACGDVKAPVVGSVCMDQCMIDVTGLGVSVGDRVTVFGDSPKELSVLASLANTIEYEVLCLISGRIPRIPKKD